jgi:trans-2,3-dihydro-3-hydroxyanthranilate isomerase
MRKLSYSLVDVFTRRPFGGNPLAVFPDGRGISATLMQALAKEFNLSETTFVLPPEDAKHMYRVRIFTPASELPMAGHPTIGTTFVLVQKRLIELTGRETTVLLEEGVGTIPVTLRTEDDGATFIQMSQPLPTFGRQYDDWGMAAAMLSLEQASFDKDLPGEVVSCGLPFLFLPVKDLEAMRRIRLRSSIYEQIIDELNVTGVFVFARGGETEGATVHSRMFAPGVGVAEDPATGSASGPLGCYLVQHGVVACDQKAQIISEQGFEMGRPSIVYNEIERQDGKFTAVRVGGYCCSMGTGIIELDQDVDA